MLGDITAADELYIVTGYTDMRKSIDGLCAIVEDQLHMDPRRSALYLFCGKRCDRVKALLWENDGFVFLYKRMEVKGRFRWPRSSRGSASAYMAAIRLAYVRVLKSNSLKHLKCREALKILAFLLLFNALCGIIRVSKRSRKSHGSKCKRLKTS